MLGFFRNRSSSRAQSAVAAAAASGGGAANDHDDDAASISSSLSSHSENGGGSGGGSGHGSSRPAFENGSIVRAIDDTVLLDQAETSLKAALKLIDEARDKRKTWVDARDLLDGTAAALDDAGLALRGRGKGSLSSGGGSGSKGGGGGSIGLSVRSVRSVRTSKSEHHGSSAAASAARTDKVVAKVRKLADEVVKKRRAVLGDVLVHDADGPWAKMEYSAGGADDAGFGIAFGDDDVQRVPDDEKEWPALVAWASQTGTAKKFAKSLHKALVGEGKECDGDGRRCVLRSMKELTVQDVAKYSRVYFVCSTFGIGRPPREGEVFYSLLQLEAMRSEENAEDLSETERERPLGGTSVAVAALGSSKFQDFAGFGKGLAGELRSVGAEMAIDVTTIDAKNGKAEQKEAFRAWRDKVVKMEEERLGERLTGTKTPRHRSVQRKSLIGFHKSAAAVSMKDTEGSNEAKSP